MAKTSLDQLFVQHKCTVMDEFNGNNLQLYEDHKIRRAGAGEPTLLE